MPQKRYLLQTRVARQKKKLNPERGLRPGSAWWVCATKKIPALSAGKKAKEKTEPGTRIASRLSLVVCATKKMPALSAGEKAKEKTEPGTRIASRLSLVEATGLELKAGLFSCLCPVLPRPKTRIKSSFCVFSFAEVIPGIHSVKGQTKGQNRPLIPLPGACQYTPASDRRCLAASVPSHGRIHPG